MLAAAAAAVANSAKKPSARPSAASPPSAPPPARTFAAKAARVAMTITTRTPTHDPRALDREPPVPRSTASRPQRPVVATPTTFGRLGRFTGGDDRARTADRRAPPPSANLPARDDASTPTPARVARKMSFGSRDIPTAAAAAAAADPLAPPPRLRVTVADLGSADGAVSTPRDDDASHPPSTRRSSTDARAAFPFAPGDGLGVGTPNASLVGTPKAPTPGEKTLEKTRDAADDAPPDWGPPVAANPFAAAAAAAAARHRVAASSSGAAARVAAAKIAAQNRPVPKVPGFYNLGNTCYLNAALQVLCGLRCFVEDARVAALAGASRDASSVFSAVARLAAARRRTRALADAGARGDDARAAGAAVLSPMEVKRAVQRRRAMFEGDAQHDAHEFMCECLDAVEEEVSALYRDGKIADIGRNTNEPEAEVAEAEVVEAEEAKEAKEAKEAETLPAKEAETLPAEEVKPKPPASESDDVALGSAFKRKASELATPPPPRASTLSAPTPPSPLSSFRASTTRGGTPVVPLHLTLCPTRRNFTCAARATLTCDACGDVSTRHETFRHLSVDLPPGEAPTTLDALLARFFAPESLERRCERPGCEGRRATLARRVVRLPRVLVVHLKRFRFDAPAPTGEENVAPRAAKVARRVVLPETTSLEAFAAFGEEATPRGPPPKSPGTVVAGTTAGTIAGTPAADTPALAAPRRLFPVTPVGMRTVADEATAATRAYADDASPSGPDAAEATYRLRGVVSHIGASIECGHYVARVRGDDDAWTTFDDEDARETPAEEVVGGARERDWYVAVYEVVERRRTSGKKNETRRA